MSNAFPLVSHFAICYNHARFVYQALETVRAQLYSNVELFIVDDMSTDDSVSIIEGWIKQFDVKCTFIKHEENKGVVKSLNECLLLAKGAYISFFATDDLLREDKITRLVEALENSKDEVGLSYGDLEVIDEEGRITHPSFYHFYLNGAPPPCGSTFEAYFIRNPVHFLGAVVKKKVFETVGFFDENLVYEDWDMGMRIAKSYEMVYTNRIVGAYRKFRGQMTDIFWNDQEKFKTILESDYKMFLKHIDSITYKKKIVNKLIDIFEKQVEVNGLSKREMINRSFFLFKRNPNFHLLLLFSSSLLNRTKMGISINKRIANRFSLRTE